MESYRQVCANSFLFMLDYIYSGRSPLANEKSLIHAYMLAKLANKYRVTRLLNLCEVHMAGIVDETHAGTVFGCQDVNITDLLFVCQVNGKKKHLIGFDINSHKLL